MLDIPKDSSTPSETPSPGAASQEVNNVSGIQGEIEMDEQLSQLEELRAKQQRELAADLKEFDQRPRPAFYPEDPLHSETQARVEQASLKADQHMQQADQYGESGAEKLSALDSRWDSAITQLRDQGVPPHTQLEVLRGYAEPPEVATTTADQTAYRYYDGEVSEARGHWLTTKPITDVHERADELALPSPGTFEAQWVIPRGTPILVGPATNKFGHMGGGEQIYVADDSVLRKA